MSAAMPARGNSVVHKPTEDQIRSILDTDPIWAAYAIGDLAPDYAPYSRWCVAEGEQGMGLTLVFSRLSPPALFAIGDPDAVALTIEQSEMPESVYLLTQQEHFDVVCRYYHLPQSEQRNMWRMYVTDPAAASAAIALPSDLQIRALEIDDSDRMRRLYAQGGPYAPDAFEAYQVADGTFFGVTDAKGEMLASGGTHVVDWKAGVAAIGNMYTHPDYRDRGLGQAVLRAIVERLLSGGVSNIVLNVDDRNPVARRLYERNGFEVHCPYLEGIAHRK